jgi:hypothetical protein
MSEGSRREYDEATNTARYYKGNKLVAEITFNKPQPSDEALDKLAKRIVQLYNKYGNDGYADKP